MSTRLLETCRESKYIYIKGIMRQVGYLLELYRDARSPEYTIFPTAVVSAMILGLHMGLVLESERR